MTRDEAWGAFMKRSKKPPGGFKSIFEAGWDAAAMDWQPIETVPRDRYVLLYSPDAVRWDGNMEVGMWFGGDEDHACFWSTGGPNGGLELGNPQSPGHYGYREPGEKYSPFTNWMDLPPDPIP